VKLDNPSPPLELTTIITAAAILFNLYQGVYQVPPPPTIPLDKVHLHVGQQAAVQGICEKRMW